MRNKKPTSPPAPKLTAWDVARRRYGKSFGAADDAQLENVSARWAATPEERRTFILTHLAWLQLDETHRARVAAQRVVQLLEELTEKVHELEERLDEREEEEEEGDDEVAEEMPPLDEEPSPSAEPDGDEVDDLLLVEEAP